MKYDGIYFFFVRMEVYMNSQVGNSELKGFLRVLVHMVFFVIELN